MRAVARRSASRESRLEVHQSERNQTARLEAAEPITWDPRPQCFSLYANATPTHTKGVNPVPGALLSAPNEVPVLALDFAEAEEAGLDLPCRVKDPELWFADTPAELEQAKSLCLDCPVRAACLSGALERREPWGVWGGEIFERGVVIPRKRPRGRPRKEVAA